MYIQSDKLHKLLCLFLLIIDKANFYYVRKIISRQKAGQFSVRRCFFIFIAVHNKLIQPTFLLYTVVNIQLLTHLMKFPVLSPSRSAGA